MENLKLYQEELLEHYRYPYNKKALEDAHIRSGVLNPSCGDSVEIYLTINNNRAIEIAFQGSGCVISQAAASMLCQKYENYGLKDLLQLTKDDILALVKIPLGPTRLRCALLPLEALHKGILEYKKQKKL